MALTKNDIVIKVHEIGLTKKAAVDAVETLIEIIKQTLEDKDLIPLNSSNLKPVGIADLPASTVSDAMPHRRL